MKPALRRPIEASRTLARFAFSAIMLSFLLLMDQAFSRWLGRPGARAASPQTASPQPASSQTA